jgi:hypothetical protein
VMLHLPFLPHQNPSDLVLGCLWRFPISPLFRVTASARAAHLYVISMSGKGKSKLLQWCLYQDIAAGRGCGLIDPHSLLMDDLLMSSPSTCWPLRLNTHTTSPQPCWRPAGAPGWSA